MQKTSYCSDTNNRIIRILLGLIIACLAVPTTLSAAQSSDLSENLSGYYSREGNSGSPAKTAGNNIYLKFYEDRWLGMLFVPYPYAKQVDDTVIRRVFDTARKRTTSAAYLKGKFDLLDQAATVQIERYGYLQDRIAFECGALSACTRSWAR